MNTITAADWVRSIRRARIRRAENRIAQFIRDQRKTVLPSHEKHAIHPPSQ